MELNRAWEPDFWRKLERVSDYNKSNRMINLF